MPASRTYRYLNATTPTSAPHRAPRAARRSARTAPPACVPRLRSCPGRARWPRRAICFDQHRHRPPPRPAITAQPLARSAASSFAMRRRFPASVSSSLRGLQAVRYAASLTRWRAQSASSRVKAFLRSALVMPPRSSLNLAAPSIAVKFAHAFMEWTRTQWPQPLPAARRCS